MQSQPITRISQIEITSRCNLRCRYCPHPKMEREKADMTEEVFAQTLYWLGQFQRDGRQKVVHLHHFGESTMHPRFLEYVDRVSDVVPEVMVSSNGVGVTREFVRGMKEAGLTKIALSIHRPEVVQKVGEWCLEEGLPYEWASGPLSASHNWAGQVEGVRNSAWARSFDCDFLGGGECVVLADGRIATCCIDAEGISATQGTVFDDLRAMALHPFSLCKTCHQHVPERFGNWREELEQLELTVV